MANESPATLTVLIDDDQRTLSIDAEALTSSGPIIVNMNQDMDDGVRLGPRFVANPDVLERCQIAGDRLLTALHTDNQAMASLMAAYLLKTLEGIATVNLDTAGEPWETAFYDQAGRLIRRAD